MATIPVMSTASAGGTITAALWNSQVRDAENFFLAVPMCVLTCSVTQSIANTAFTSLNFDTEVRDNDGMHSTVTNTSRITCVTAGWYQYAGVVGWGGSVTGARLSHWSLNGSTIAGSEVASSSPLATAEGIPASSGITFLNVGDYLEIQIWQSSGGALLTGANASRASVKWVGQ